MLTCLGSKYHILQEFQKKALAGENCMIVNGFNPSFSLTEFTTLLCDKLLALNREGVRQDIVVGFNSLFRHIDVGSVTTVFSSNISCLYLDSQY